MGHNTGNMITKTRLEKKAALSSPVKVSSSKSRVTISSSSSSFSSAGNVTSSKALLESSAMIAGSLHLTGRTAPLRFLYNKNIHTNLRSKYWKIWADFFCAKFVFYCSKKARCFFCSYSGNVRFWPQEVMIVHRGTPLKIPYEIM